MFFISENNAIGTGLGLYIAKESIEKIGGSITVNSHRGLGSKFSICLPSKDQERTKNPLESGTLT